MENPSSRPAGFMEDLTGRLASNPSTPRTKSVFGSTGMACVATPRGTPPMSAREPSHPSVAMEVDPPDKWAKKIQDFEAQFFVSTADRDKVASERRSYPRKIAAKALLTGALAGEDEEEAAPRARLKGFGLGAEKLFATTSAKLPVSAYTVYVEMHGPNSELWGRMFKGLNTLGDMKKWIFEKLMIPGDAFVLTYAEPGKATLNDDLRLLTTDDSLEVRSFCTTRAVHNTYQGIPGVHSTGAIATTNLYARVKCMHCGNLLNSLAPSKKCKTFVSSEEMYALMDARRCGADPSNEAPASKAMGAAERRTNIPSSALALANEVHANKLLEGCWIRPDENKHCYYHTRGYELFKAARDTNKGGRTEFARICLNTRNFASQLDRPVKGMAGGVQLKVEH